VIDGGLLPGWTLSPIAELGGSRRSAVRRARATRPDGSSTTVIVKTFAQPEGWVRESAALAVLPPEVRAPGLLASSPQPPTVVMSDLGEGPSIADALLGADPSAAAGAIYAWVDAIAALHIATLGSRNAFQAELNTRAAPGSVPLTVATTWVDECVGKLGEAGDTLGVRVPPGLVDLWRHQLQRLDNDDASALSPADTCPDNNVATGDGLALIDFESAEWRHVAWDVAYLRVPWPTCWCAWRLPDDLSSQAIARYRARVAPHLPYVTTTEFDDDLAIASAIWSVAYSAFFLTYALGDNAAPRRSERIAPKRQAFLLHRLDLARRTSAAPEVAAYADELRKALVDRWGEVPLALAPAFH
jgi:hypothetical protein